MTTNTMALQLPSAGNGTPGRQPPIPSAVLATMIFLATEVMFFAGLLSASIIVRAQSPNWPPPFAPRLPLELTAANTLMLLASGVGLWRAVGRFLAGGSRLEARRGLNLAGALGTVFLVIQGSEWVSLVAHGLTASSSRFGAVFYTLIAAHAVHALVAVVVLGLVARSLGRLAAPHQEQARLRALRLYWTFVVGLWPLLFGLLYLS